jgi:hypothetical protein
MNARRITQVHTDCAQCGSNFSYYISSDDCDEMECPHCAFVDDVPVDAIEQMNAGHDYGWGYRN